MNHTVPNKPKLAFMGTPEFARLILAKLHAEGFPICAVYAQPDKPVGRGRKLQSPPVALYAQEHSLPLYQPVHIKTPEATQELLDLKPDFTIVAAYGKILSAEFLNIATRDTLNVHASLLPLYRGAAPINYALLDGQGETGVAIMSLVPELDAGPVYLERRLEITLQDDAISLTTKLSELGAQALITALDQIWSKSLKAKPQDHTQATFAPKLTRELSEIDWTNNALKVFNQIRALLPWPVACTQLQGKALKVYASQVLSTKSNQSPGTIVHIGKAGLTVATDSNDLLLKDVQLHGKKRMNAFDLANGLRLKAGIRLE